MTVKSSGTPKIRPEFWRRYRLEELNDAEWEALCDGCGRCCLVCLEDEDTGDIWESDVACRYFDPHSRQCGCYTQRTKLVPGCINLTPEVISATAWMPESCTYRLLDEGKSLPAWHPLLTEDRNTVHEAGIAVREDVLSESGLREESIKSHITRLRKTRQDIK